MVLGQPRAVSTFPRHPASPQPLAAASLRSPSLPSKLAGHNQSSETLNVDKHMCMPNRKLPLRVALGGRHVGLHGGCHKLGQCKWTPVGYRRTSAA